MNDTNNLQSQIPATMPNDGVSGVQPPTRVEPATQETADPATEYRDPPSPVQNLRRSHETLKQRVEHSETVIRALLDMVNALQVMVANSQPMRMTPDVARAQAFVRGWPDMVATFPHNPTPIADFDDGNLVD